MAKLPKYLSFLRSIIYKIRRAILGPDWNRSADSGAAIAALDRLALLESQVNWRLLGLPARIENLKMERLPLLADGTLAEEALGRLRESECLPLSLIREAFAKTNGLVCAVSSWSNAENDLVSKCKVKVAIIDPTDVMSCGESSLMGDIILKLQIIDAAARWTRPEFDCIWLSNGIERLTPLQQQVLFLQAREGLRSDGYVSGYFADHARSDPGAYWANPNRLRPVTKMLIERISAIAGFDAPVFRDEPPTQGIAYSLFVIKLK